MKKALFVGLGSIGQRHLRNLRQLGEFEILAWRRRGNALPEEFSDLPVKSFATLEEALDNKPDFALICAPPVVQQEALLKIVRAGVPFFIEKPIASSSDGLEEVMEIVDRQHLVSMVGYNLRFHPVHQELHRLIAAGVAGNITAVRASVGQYLPDWHPHEDYRKGYSASSSLGGGVILDLIHELDFVYALFGAVRELKAMYGKNSHLEIDTEDTAEVLLRFETGIIGSVHVDYVQRKAIRNGMIIGDEATILYDLLASEVRILRAGKDDEHKTFEFVRNDMYLGELRQFLDAVNGSATITSDFRSGYEVLKLALRAKST